MHTTVHIRNPNPFALDLGGTAVNFSAAMGDVPLADGRIEEVRLATGNSTLSAVTTINNTAIPAWWIGHIDRGERTDVAVDADVILGRVGQRVSISRTHPVETDLIGAFASDEQRPVNADRPLVDDPILYVNETSATWGDVTATETPLEKTFVIYNPNLQPYVLTELRYEITLNDIAVGSGSTDEIHVIAPLAEETIVGTTVIRAERLDDWWVTHLDETPHGHQVSELRMDFSATIALPTGDEIDVPLDAFTYEETIRTDVFDEALHPSPSNADDEAATQSVEETDDGEAAGDDGILPL